jgi:MerR family transcriptional regulator, redox-sensitive transcriptional activator SoxR
VHDAIAIGELARRAGLAPSAIRYYESIGLLPEPARVAGQRRYDPATLGRLRVIGAAQQAGFTLREIRELTAGGAGLRELARRKLPEVRAELERTRRVKRWLHAAEGCDCVAPDECALFEDEPQLQVVRVQGCRRPARRPG